MITTLFLFFVTMFLVGLKVFGILDLSWVWVFSPIYMPIIMFMIGIGIFFPVSILIDFSKKLKDTWK